MRPDAAPALPVLPTLREIDAELRRRRAVQLASTVSGFLGRYCFDLPGFVRECFVWKPGEAPHDYQRETLEELQRHRRACVRAPHAVGKTALAAWVVLWFALTREDWKAPTTASAWRQLTKFLWPEIKKWARRLRWDVIGRAPFDERTELLELSLKLVSGEAFALASDDPALIEGAHAAHLLYILDEAKAIPARTWDAVEGSLLQAGDVYALAISTPGEPNGRFFEIQTRKPGTEDWWVRHVTLEEGIRAGRIDATKAAQRRLQWGESSAVYRNRVLGEFAGDEADQVIPLSWLEAAQERWRAWREAGSPGAELVQVVGADVGGGVDPSVLALRTGWIIAELRVIEGERDTMALVGRIGGLLQRHPGCRALVDVIGIGAGTVHRLRELGYDVEGFNAAAATDHRDRSGELGFVNLRAAAWWSLREVLDPAATIPVALPPDDFLTGELTAPTWRVTSGGRVQVEPKDAIRERLGRSTDRADAVVMALAHGTLDQWRTPQVWTLSQKPEAPKTEEEEQAVTEREAREIWNRPDMWKTGR